MAPTDLSAFFRYSDFKYLTKHFTSKYHILTGKKFIGGAVAIVATVAYFVAKGAREKSFSKVFLKNWKINVIVRSASLANMLS